MTASLQVALVVADNWGWHHGDMGGGWWIVMVLGMVLFWALVAGGIVWLVRGGAVGFTREKIEEPLEILDRRLASGEVSVEEYEERRRVLLGK